MGQKNYSRRKTDHKTGRMVQPEFGARHPIVFDDELGFFFANVRTALGMALPAHEEEDKTGRLISRPPFHLYEDPSRTAITIMERRLPRRHAERQRLRWAQKDVGRIKQNVANEIARLKLSRFTLSVDLTTVVRVGAGGRSGDGRKIGIIPDQASAETELFVAENEIIVDQISGGGLARFNEVEQDFVPHLTLGRLYNEIGDNNFNEAIKVVQALLPLTVEVLPISLYSEQSVG